MKIFEVVGIKGRKYNYVHKPTTINVFLVGEHAQVGTQRTVNRVCLLCHIGIDARPLLSYVFRSYFTTT